MIKVEKIKAKTPAITELDSSVNNTLIPTLPHRMVVNRKFESERIFSTFDAALLLFATSISRRRRVTLKNARFSPENMADWVIQKMMPSHINVFIINPILINPQQPVMYTPVVFSIFRLCGTYKIYIALQNPFQMNGSFYSKQNKKNNIKKLQKAILPERCRTWDKSSMSRCTCADI